MFLEQKKSDFFFNVFLLKCKFLVQLRPTTFQNRSLTELNIVTLLYTVPAVWQFLYEERCCALVRMLPVSAELVFVR